KTKASLHIGSLNVNGRGPLSGPRDHKWNAINQLLREERLGVLCLQETHLDQTHLDTIHELYGRRIRIWNSGSTSSTTVQGVAVILNRELVDVSGVAFQELIPGRAILLTMHWHADKYITILNVYAPNSPTENAAFWTRLRSMAEKGRFKKPDVITGDFNLVEEAIDRLPAREDSAPAVAALRDFTRHLDLYDGWRLSEPHMKDYTYPQRGSMSRSRLDRIYTSDPLIRTSHSWTIRTTGVPTDHRLVSTKLNTANTPFIGKGRWAMPVHLTEDDVFMNQARTLGIETIKEMKDTERDDAYRGHSRIQHLHKLFKDGVKKLAQDRAKRKSPKLKAEINRLRAHIQEVEGCDTYQTSGDLQTDAAILHDRVHDLEKKRQTFSKLTTTARYVLNAERVSKYWSRIN
ncbi:Endonuclease/exonuclease/phosphatase, partial [Fomitopsis serialis]|uniref:Endonuclease/exonuclease/phosphatase n=1 Tax=Fomitopsis serialis TaxID=139415 RepID=UPI00200871A0